MTRDPRRDPQIGDVVVIVRANPWGVGSTEHHLGVVERTARTVWFLDGNWTTETGGMRGGSPDKWSLSIWRAETADGRASVRAEEHPGIWGWDAIVVSWKTSG